MQVLSVLTGKPQPTPAKSGATGHFKTPVPFAEIGPLGVTGDYIADLENHGGPDQAVYIFGDSDRAWWSEEMGTPLAPGYFGENLLISDLETRDLAAGDQFRIGEVLLEVTSPRIPCATYAAHVGDPQAIKRFYKAARPGVYTRVLASGPVRQGDAVQLVPYAGVRLTMEEMMAQYLQNHRDDDFLRKALHTPAHYKLHQLARTRLGKA